MQALTALRLAQQALAAQGLGHDIRQPRGLVGQIQLAGEEADLRPLPVDLSGFSPLQDPATGNFYFMIGFSAIGGEDEIE